MAATFEVNLRLHGPLPKELDDESAAYLQNRMRVWQAKDAQAELGKALLARRPAVDENGAAYGETLTYSDPTNKYEKFDLTFDVESKKMREIRIYPWNMTVWAKNAICMKSKDDGGRGPSSPDRGVTTRYITKKSPRNAGMAPRNQPDNISCFQRDRVFGPYGD